MLKSQLIRNFFIIFSVILLVPMLCFGIYSAEREKEYKLLAKTEELNKIATLIERRIIENFDGILISESAEKLPDGDQALILNKHLQPLIEEISAIYPNHGIGIASRDLVRRVAMAPGLNYAALVEPANQNKGFKVYKYGEPDVFQVDSANWDNKRTLVVTYPIFQKGKLVGHTWANTKIEDISIMYNASIQRWLIVSILSWLLLIIAMSFLLKRFSSSIERLIEQIVLHGNNPSAFKDFPQLIPVLDTVTRLRQDYQQEVNKLSNLIQACPEPSVVVDDKGVITSYNEAYAEYAKRYLGKQNELVGSSLGELMEAAGLFHESLVVTKVLSGEKVDHEHFGYNGGEFLVSGTPLFDELIGEVTGGIILLADITERENLRREVVKLDRLNAIGEMAASVAHEIRNPMTSVRGYLQLMALKNGDKERYSLLIEELDRANAIIEDFLSLARNRAVSRELYDINHLVEGIYPIMYANAVSAGVMLELDLESGLPNFLMSEKEIKQLVINLCRNAVEAVARNGHIIIRTKHRDNVVRLEVEDNGNGIPANDIERIMEPFYTTKGNGTGLGLSICQSIAEGHGAVLTIRSSEGVGTIVSIDFPISS